MGNSITTKYDDGRSINSISNPTLYFTIIGETLTKLLKRLAKLESARTLSVDLQRINIRLDALESELERINDRMDELEHIEDISKIHVIRLLSKEVAKEYQYINNSLPLRIHKNYGTT